MTFVSFCFLKEWPKIFAEASMGISMTSDHWTVQAGNFPKHSSKLAIQTNETNKY